jgi:hypothetical protein
VAFRLRKQGFGLLESPLPAPELGESYEAVGSISPCFCKIATRLGEGLLSLVPGTTPDQHLRVVVPAQGEDHGVVEPPCDLLHPTAPLSCAIEVADALARVDQVAANELDESGVPDFARHRGRRRFVQVPHPLLDIADGHPREPIEREEQHLPGEVADLARDGETLAGQRERSRRIVRGERGGRTNVDQHSVLLADRHVLEEVARTLEPTASLGGPTEVHAVDRELEGQT